MLNHTSSARPAIPATAPRLEARSDDLVRFTDGLVEVPASWTWHTLTGCAVLTLGTIVFTSLVNWFG
jgi:hypothetical protein